MPIYSFKGFKPIIKSSSFIHPTASIGDVHIGENVYIGPAIRGDWGTIVIEDGCNIKKIVSFMFSGITVTL